MVANSKTDNTDSRAAATATKGVTDLHSDGGSFHLNAVKRRRQSHRQVRK